MRILLTLLCFAGLVSCQKESTGHMDRDLEMALYQASGGLGLSFFQLPRSDEFQKIPQDPKNPLTAEKVQLGKFLFHESALGLAPRNPISAGMYSCASCHFASAGFQACKVQGVGEGGLGFGINGESRWLHPSYPLADIDVQPIRSPSAMHVAYQTNILWNGQFGATHVNEGTESAWEYGTPKATNHLGYQGAETQAIAGMGVHRLAIDKAWADQYGYTALFRAAFPGIPDDQLFTAEYAGLAIAAFERTLMADRAPFQLWLQGNRSAMTEKEKRGALVFFRDANCTTCHSGPALNSMTFHALGMKDLFQTGAGINASAQSPENLGRGGFTKRPEDMYAFKVPQLYNLKDSPVYGHGGSFVSLRDVVDYKNRAIKENALVPDDRLSPHFTPQGLTPAQIDDLTHFLTFSLRDPYLSRYQPTSVHSGSCIPNNDPLSKLDLNCH